MTLPLTLQLAFASFVLALAVLALGHVDDFARLWAVSMAAVAAEVGE